VSALETIVRTVYGEGRLPHGVQRVYYQNGAVVAVADDHWRGYSLVDVADSDDAGALARAIDLAYRRACTYATSPYARMPPLWEPSEYDVTPSETQGTLSP
jgi:hypothetical protein